MWYTERPGKQQTKSTINEKRRKGGTRLSPQWPCVDKQKCLGSNLKDFYFQRVHPLYPPTSFLIIKVKVVTSGSAQSSVLSLLSGCPLTLSPFTPHPIGWHTARHPLGIPSTVRAAVFVLPNSIPFHSLSAHSVYFGALLHRGV